MNNFTFCTPTKIVFGKNAESNTANLLREAGATKVLVHYGGGSAIRSGLIGRIKNDLDDAGIRYITLGGVMPNPRLSLVREGIKLVKSEDIDFILAVGGGSVIDSGKAIAYGVANDGDVWDFYCGKRAPLSAMPVGVVLTIAAAGSEMSNSSVITNEDGMQKRGCNSELSRPVFALMNPELTMTLPDYQTACGCTDIIMHTLERYFTSQGNMELTDAIAAGLIKTVMNNALILKDDPNDYNARAEIMWAGSLSHNGLTGCGNGGNDFATHRLEHELSGMFDVAHGAGLAALWGSWARYVMDSCIHRFTKFALDIMNVAATDNAGNKRDDMVIANEGIDKMEGFFREIGMPVRVSEFGIKLTDEQIYELSTKCNATCGGELGAAKVLHKNDFVEIYKMAR